MKEEKTEGEVPDPEYTQKLHEQFRQDSIDCEDHMHDMTKSHGLFKAFCPNDTMTGVPVSAHKAYPFDTLLAKVKDTLVYSFKVSSECCVKYYGSYHMSLDTLVFSYAYCGDYCDCHCDYVLTYKVPTKEYKFKQIVIRSGDQ